MAGKITTLPNVGFGFKSGFCKNGERCRTKYSEGTTVARERFRVLVGTAEEMEMVICD
jgi:hypothetical protein